MQIDTAKLKASTKTLISGVMGFGALMQVRQVSDVVLRVTDHHPHLASIVAALTAVAFVLHTPKVQDLLGIKRTIEKKETTEEVVLAKDATP